MSAVAARGERLAERERPWARRLLDARPLVIVFAWLAAVYVWQASRLGTPWLFTDELEFTQLARSIAETGHAARRGDAHSFVSLSVLLMAPAWLIDNTKTAYDVAKYEGVLVMTAAAFPAYGIACTVVSRWLAVIAAALTVSIPAMAYGSLLILEPLAYFTSTLVLFLIVKALVTRSRAWLAGAVVGCLLAPLVRSQISVLGVVLALALAATLWHDERAARLRAGLGVRQRLGLAAAAIVGALLLFELGRLGSHSFDVAVGLPGRMLQQAVWAAGALTIGLGVLPVLAALTAIVRPRGEGAEEELRVFRRVTLASVAVFCLYTAIKGTYVSTIVFLRVEERNLIYLAPLLFAGFVLWLERPQVRFTVLAVSTALVAAVITGTQYQLDYPYVDAPGFGILTAANRGLEWSTAVSQNVLIGLLCVSVLIVAAPRLIAASPRASRRLILILTALLLAWNLTGEITTANGGKALSDQLLSNLPKPVDWVDRSTGGSPVLYLGQRIDDNNGLNLLEFWNRSVRRVWSMDGSAPGPGPTLTPDVVDGRGRLSANPGYRYVVADFGVYPEGRLLESKGLQRLYRIRGPLRLRRLVLGLYRDGWMGNDSSYTQFATPGGRPGTMEVTISKATSGGNDPPGQVTLRLGTFAVGAGRQPTIGRVTQPRVFTIKPHEAPVFSFETPPPPFRVEVHIEPTFVPHELDERSGDVRQLTAQVGYRFIPGAPLAKRP